MLAIATDAATNSSSPSAWRAFTVDAVAPAAPTREEPRPGQVLATHTPSIHGTAEPSSTISVHVDGETAPGCTAMAAGDGSWSCTPSSPLAEGAHALTVSAMDAVGNTDPGSLSLLFTVDTHPPE